MTCQACEDFNRGGNMDFHPPCRVCRARSIACGETFRTLKRTISKAFDGDFRTGLRLVLSEDEQLSTKEKT